MGPGPLYLLPFRAPASLRLCVFSDPDQPKLRIPKWLGFTFIG
jgi:hypothetical protein